MAGSLSNPAPAWNKVEEGDPEIRISIAASTAHSHYLGFSGFATGFTFANTALNVPAVLGLKFKMMLRTRSSAGNIRKVRFRYGRNSVNRSPGRNNLPEGRERVAPKYITGFIEIENMKNEYFARKMASSDYPYDYPRH
ncbi:predicted protein [Sclerotinia sclerotiorum 1980 UF-70]|uniref:Uncharacterized protein n=1 Tax=Sclerotinia sclerotiorum (strain ATCC 18683 / 1980 / Ss-1) TaxID=665079 RepID=A7EGX2_SCLS1|nr:predicted protein [Sclerotinia sclerotiorum 1980 UF-70]EDO02088.1 predicted protein [Sclerotinia sclerotiorum 1980 UF-70]